MVTAGNKFENLHDLGETVASFQKKLESVSIEDPTKATFDKEMTTMEILQL